MLTLEEVRAIPLFSSLPTGELERLVRTSADMALQPGEFAVHEGGERALFAVLSGKIEVVKQFDGVERTLGWRLPGAIFGEVPLAFATPFPGGYRAAEASRVMRVEPHHYFAITSASAEVAEKVGALARERIGGLQGIALQPPKAQIAVFGDRWDPACGDLRRFLSRNQIAHDWLLPDSAEAAAAWPDGLPSVGRLWPFSDRLLTATGYRKWGLAQAAAAAEILRDAVQGREHPWAHAYDPHRVSLVTAGLSDLVKENADAGLHFVGDRLRRRSRASEPLGRGEGRIVSVGGRQVAVSRDDDGALHAVSARCTHIGCIVDWNPAERSWDCPCHGSRFAPDGKVLQGPAVKALETREPPAA